MSYVELHSHSAFSFLDGASAPDELAAAAAELGYGALALTDHDGLWGSMEFAHACHGLGVRPITGAEVTVDPSNAGFGGRIPPNSTLTGAGRADDSSSGRFGAHIPPNSTLTGAGRADDSSSGRFGAHIPPNSTLAEAGVGAGARTGCFHLTLLVEDARGYRNLCRLLTIAHSGTRPGTGDRRDPLPPSLPFAALADHATGLVCLSGCARDGALAGRIARGRYWEARELGERLLAIFGPDRFRVELQRPYWRGDRARNRRLAALAERLGVPTVATGNAHAHARRRMPLQDALVAIRLGGTLESTEPARRGNSSAALASPEAMAARFADHPEAVRETGRLAERLRFDLARELGYRYPGAEDPDADRKLAEACRTRFGERYDRAPERAEAERRLREELEMIARLGLSGFFLLHRDLLELAREVAAEIRGPDTARALLPPGRGRGSSVSSIVCYLTGLSHVDPVASGLFLGRFLNDEVTAMPDIDLDFPRDIREALIPRVHERYGADRSALVAAFPTYRSRSAVRELGAALGLPAGEIERVARAGDIYGGSDELERDVAEAIGAARARSHRWRALYALAREIRGLPRHASQHPGGMVLSTRPLIDLCPVVPAAMEGRQIVQWDKDSCADAGFLKIDLLGLGMLSAVERAVEEIARIRGERIDLSRVPLDDPEVFGAIRAAETTGVFQIESRAQMQMLPRSRPESLDELAVQVAIVRPGPIQGGAVHPYLERRKRLREDPSYEVPYEHPSLEPILAETLGAIVFQDQVIQVAMALAGFSAGEAEGLRRAMSRKRSAEALRGYRERFVAGALARGIDREIAERVYEQVEGFSGFGFPKSHAVAFALLAYQSTWLRVHYGPELLCGLLNEQPMGFYPPDALVHEAQRRGIAVRGPDVNRSGVDCRVEPAGDPEPSCAAGSGDRQSRTVVSVGGEPSVRIGLGYVHGLATDDAEAVVGERERGGPYRDLAELAARSGIGRDALERLAWAGACGEGRESVGGEGRESVGGEGRESVGGEGRRPVGGSSRRSALWRIGVARGGVRRAGGEQLALPLPVPEAPPLAPQTPWERVVAEYETTGMALEEHPMALMRRELPGRVSSSRDLASLPDGSGLRIAGMVVARQRPATARGVVFMLLEDEWGTVNLVIPPPVYERHRLIVRTAPFALVRGRLERREGITNVLVAELHRLERPDLAVAEVRPIEPSVERETGRSQTRRSEAEIAALGAALPATHSFGRRGR